MSDITCNLGGWGRLFKPGDLVRVPMGDLGVVLRNTNPTVYEHPSCQVYTEGSIVWFSQNKLAKSDNNLTLIQDGDNNEP
jgi:hypothetical protein